MSSVIILYLSSRCDYCYYNYNITGSRFSLRAWLIRAANEDNKVFALVTTPDAQPPALNIEHSERVFYPRTIGVRQRDIRDIVQHLRCIHLWGTDNTEHSNHVRILPYAII